MSARREAQSSMPGLAEPRESGRSLFGPSLTAPARPINVAAAMFMPIPADVAPRGDGNTINIYGGTFNQAQNMAFNQHHHYPHNISAQAGASVFRDSTHVLRGWTNRSLWISPQSISSKRTAKTGRVFVSRTKYKSWRTAVNGVFWASGKPGAGKTYLACAAFDEINDSVKDCPNDACTVIYLKHNDQWTTWDIVAFIIVDLVESKPLSAALEAIRETLRKQRSMGERPSLSDLMALLQKIVKLYGRCYILIDGLDEMHVDIQVELIKIIADLEANVLLTSRPLNLVQDKLAKIALKKPVFTTVAAENEDLRLYIEDTIDRTPTFDSLLDDAFPKEQLIEKIQVKADGMFLHAMLQMEALRHCITQEELLGLLDGFPPGLDAMYAETMRRIQGQHPSHASFAKTALLWLVHADGSMTIDDLRCATATVAPDYRVEPKRMLTEDNLLTICCGLVTVDSTTRQARLIHDTARDALAKLLLDHCPKPQSMMATACITRLVEFQFHQSTATGVEELEPLYTKGPLLRYAHLAVQHHVRKGVEEDPSLLDRVEQFVRLCSSFPYLDALHSSWGVHGLTAIHVAILFNQQVIVEKLLNNGAGAVNEKTHHRLGGISPLAIAALEGFDNLTAYLLTLPDIHANDGDLTPLMCAARQGRDIIVEQVLLHFEGVAKGQGDQGRARVAMEVNRAGRFGRTALRFAAFGGHAAVVRLLLGVEGVDIDKAQENGWTPLLSASQEGHVDVVKLLLSAPGIDVNQAMNYGVSPLFIASQQGHIEVVKLLLSAPVIDVNQASNDGASPLFIASQEGHIEVVKLLLCAPGIDVNQASNDGASSLFQASRNGHVEVVKLLLSAPGIDVNQATDSGASPLLRGCQQGHVEVVKLLLSAPGIDVNQPWINGASPLFQASQSGHVEVVKLLLCAPGIDVNQAMNTGASPLFQASRNGHVEVVKLLLCAPGIDVNQASNDGASPLLIASQQGHVEVVELLLSAPGIDINQPGNNGASPLFVASQNGHIEVVKLLLRAPGIDVNQATNLGASPLFIASHNGHAEVVKLLLCAPGIDVNRATNLGASPLFIASQNGHIEVVKLLLSAPGIGINQAKNTGSSPLFIASQEGHVEVVKPLLSAPGIDVNLRNIEQVSPLIMASYKGHKDIVKVLLDVPGINIANEDSFGDTALTAASSKGHEEIAQLLSAALDRKAAPPVYPTSNAASNDAPEAGQSTSPMAASPHAPSPACQSPASPSQPLDTCPDIPDIGGALPQATSSHFLRPASPSPDPPQTARQKRQREGTRSPSPPAASTSEQDERTPKRPRVGGSDGGRTHSGGQEPGLDSPSTSEQAGPLPAAPVAPLANLPAPPLPQASTSHIPRAASPPLDPPQDERAPKRQREDTSPLSSAPDSPTMDASHDERAPKRGRVGGGG